MLKQWLNKNTIESIQILKDRYLSLATPHTVEWEVRF